MRAFGAPVNSGVRLGLLPFCYPMPSRQRLESGFAGGKEQPTSVRSMLPERYRSIRSVGAYRGRALAIRRTGLIEYPSVAQSTSAWTTGVQRATSAARDRRNFSGV
jgi:hypothetical protein